MSGLYYIISVKHTQKRDKFITFWAPDNKGYRFRLQGAGQYTHETVMEHPGYYNSGHADIAVPVEVVDAMTTMTTPADMLDGPDGPAVLNKPKNWRKLMAAVIAPTKNPIKPNAIYFGKNRKY